MYWLLSANPNLYNHFESFYDNGFIDWHQNGNYEIGDIVFIYSSKPFSKVTFETVVEKINIPYEDCFDDSKYWFDISKKNKKKNYMRLRLINTFMIDALSLNTLLKHGLNAAPQSKIKLNGELLEYIIKTINNYGYLLEDSNNDDNNLIDSMIVSNNTNSIDISLLPPKPIQSKIGISWPRNPMCKVQALKNANYKCELNESHYTFIRKGSDVNYTEAHHLIPLAAQGEERFKNVNLDCPENIVSLCSNCHNHLHYGKDAKVILEPLFNSRKDKLLKRGIKITLEELLEYYK